MAVGYYYREGRPPDFDWKCSTCTNKDKTDRACPLPQYKKFLKPGRGIQILLANGEVLEQCPVGALDIWATSMLQEYTHSKEFGTDPDMLELEFQAFRVIASEIHKVREIGRQRDA